MMYKKNSLIRFLLPVLLSCIASYVLVFLFHGCALDIVGANHIDSYSYYYGHMYFNQGREQDRDAGNNNRLRRKIGFVDSVGIYNISTAPDTIHPRLWVANHINDLVKYNPKAVILDFIFQNKENSDVDDLLIESIKRLQEAVNGELYTACHILPDSTLYHSFFTLEHGIKFGHVRLDPHHPGINIHELIPNNLGITDTVQWLPLKCANHPLDSVWLSRKLIDYTILGWDDATATYDTPQRTKHFLFDDRIVIVGNVDDLRDLHEPNFMKHVWAPMREDNILYWGISGVYLLAYGINAIVNERLITYDSLWSPFAFMLFFSLIFGFLLCLIDMLVGIVKSIRSIPNIIMDVIHALLIILLLFIFEFYVIPISSSLFLYISHIAFDLEYTLVSIALLSALYPSFKE